MPELPEIEIVKRSLFKMINKAKIIDIKINNKNLRYKIPGTLYKKLINKKILKISRRSKYLIFHFKDKLLLVHLGMSGKFLGNVLGIVYRKFLLLILISIIFALLIILNKDLLTISTSGSSGIS